MCSTIQEQLELRERVARQAASIERLRAALRELLADGEWHGLDTLPNGKPAPAFKTARAALAETEATS